MQKLLENNVEGIYALTNHLVENAKATEHFNQNHMAKSLVGHIDQYKKIIEYFLSEKQWKKSETTTKQ